MKNFKIVLHKLEQRNLRARVGENVKTINGQKKTIETQTLSI